MGKYVYEVVNQELNVGRVKFEMPITQPRSVVELVAIYLSL